MVTHADVPTTSQGDKPGWQTTEFWLTLVAMVVGLLISQGVFPSESPWAKGLTLAATVLAALGYSYSRSLVKKERVRASSAIKAAKIHKGVE